MENNEPQNPSAGPAASINISGNKNAVITVGNQNLIQASIKLREVNETDISSETGNWQQVWAELEKLQLEVKSLSDEYEELRDIELVPEVAKAKAAAKQIIENPAAPKKTFIEKLARIGEVAGKVVDVGAKLSPFILTIGKLLGITL